MQLGSKGSLFVNARVVRVGGCQVKLCDALLTYGIPENFRDE